MFIDILGNKWEIIKTSNKDEPRLKDADGFTDWTERKIVVNNDFADATIKDTEMYARKVLRHEIVHAFLMESGLNENSNDVTMWARNEEMVDWFAIQGPKIYKAWEQAGALDV